MTTDKALALARRELDRWGFESLPVRLTNARRTLGNCWWIRQDGKYYPKVIGLSRHWIAVASDEELIDTIKHEVAHACAIEYASDRGHGLVWKAWAQLLGARPEAFTNGGIPYQWELSCDSCRRVVVRRHRRLLKWSQGRHCSLCGKDTLGKLTWRKVTP